MRPAVGADGADPGQLGLLEDPAGLLPASGACIWSAEPLVERGVWLVHEGSSVSVMSRSIRVTAARPPVDDRLVRQLLRYKERWA